MKWKLEMETRNWKQKWKCKLFTAVVLARFNCCCPSALPASSFCFASLASLASLPDLRCPSCSVICDCLEFLTWFLQVCSQQYSIFGVPYIVTSWLCINSVYEIASISALENIGGGGVELLEMGLLYPGPGYEATIFFTHCKQSKLEVGLGTRLQE